MPVSGLGPYDDSNIFARLLRGEIPSRRVYEDEWAVAFHDISPQAVVHVLVVPRGRWVSLADFSAGASDAEIAGFFRAVGQVARQLDLEEPGYRALANVGGPWRAGSAALPRPFVRRPGALRSHGHCKRKLTR